MSSAYEASRVVELTCRHLTLHTDVFWNLSDALGTQLPCEVCGTPRTVVAIRWLPDD